MIDLSKKENRVQLFLTVHGLTKRSMNAHFNLPNSFRSKAMDDARETPPDLAKIDNLIQDLEGHYAIDPDIFEPSKLSNQSFWESIQEMMSENTSLKTQPEAAVVVDLKTHRTNE